MLCNVKIFITLQIFSNMFSCNRISVTLHYNVISVMIQNKIICYMIL